ncbi:MAG: hypothetical protein JXM73_05465 [Anaerolineae bacterium]|nr:hypothetical protein [Anaerolineae bacterium]
MNDTDSLDAGYGWLPRWRLARQTIVTTLSWIIALPVVARLMRWRRHGLAGVQSALGALSGLIWGRIGWIGVKRYGFSNEDAFLAGGLAGAMAPTLTLTLRRLGWGAHLNGKRPRLSVYPIVWLRGFVLGGFTAAVGALLARLTRPRLA